MKSICKFCFRYYRNWWYIKINGRKGKSYGYDKTLAQMTDEERINRIKYESVDSMQEFAKWYKNNVLN